jgi:hypothetical protein
LVAQSTNITANEKKALLNLIAEIIIKATLDGLYVKNYQCNKFITDW